jgi:hypothetical protein
MQTCLAVIALVAVPALALVIGDARAQTVIAADVPDIFREALLRHRPVYRFDSEAGAGRSWSPARPSSTR